LVVERVRVRAVVLRPLSSPRRSAGTDRTLVGGHHEVVGVRAVALGPLALRERVRVRAVVL
jgi:hypothetical protein